MTAIEGYHLVAVTVTMEIVVRVENALDSADAEGHALDMVEGGRYLASEVKSREVGDAFATFYRFDDRG